MTSPDALPRDDMSPSVTPLTPAERATLTEADAQRRLQLLRVTVPGLLVVTLIALPFAIQADVSSASTMSSLQDGIGVVAFGISFWAMRTRHVNVASFFLFAGVSGVIVYLLLSDALLQGPLDLPGFPAFALFILPIAIAGIFGSPRATALATAATAIFTLLLILLTPHTPGLAAALNASDGLALFTIPLSTQIAFGILMFAATRGFRRTQRELVDVRVAYEREKELDRLKDQFIASVNHELRTPIMALQGYIALAREFGLRGDTIQQAQMLGRGTEAVEHLASLVKGVLDVRDIDTELAQITPTAFTLLPVIVDATHLLDPRAPDEQTRVLHVHVPSDLTVFADADRVRQVMLNLLSNASKYSPPGSPIEVTARMQESGSAARRGWRIEPLRSPMVEIAVRDYGSGVPPDQAPLLFQRFVRLERDIASPVVGTGLGLAICRTYVEAMGGHIWVESIGVPGEGSTFIFTLPLSLSTPEPAPPATGEEPAATVGHAP
jgi:signal transduction histidine kinase